VSGLRGEPHPVHPDTITRRFKKLAALAGLPEIDLHDVRHSYATLGRDAKIDWKTLSKRIGHSDVAFTMKQYVQTDLEADRQVANTLAELIVGGSLVSESHPDARSLSGIEHGG
jgi:integrase